MAYARTDFPPGKSSEGQIRTHTSMPIRIRCAPLKPKNRLPYPLLLHQKALMGIVTGCWGAKWLEIFGWVAFIWWRTKLKKLFALKTKARNNFGEIRARVPSWVSRTLCVQFAGRFGSTISDLHKGPWQFHAWPSIWMFKGCAPIMGPLWK